MISRGIGPLVAMLLLGGCPKAPVSTMDAELPERASGLSERPPQEILEEGASSLEPSHRGHALGFLIATAEQPGGGEWSARALFDPDAWVQRQGVLALAGRLDEPESQAHLAAYLERKTADPYSRGYAAVRLRGSSTEAIRDSLHRAWTAEPQRWRAAPLALGALVHGDESALEPLSAALARGDLALEPQFVDDVGHSGRSELLEALQEGESWVEEELALAYAVARMSLGDPSGEQVLRKALSSSDTGQQLEALDHLSTLRDPAADALLRRARGQGSELARTWAELALAARGQADASVIAAASQSEDSEIRALAAGFAGVRLSRGELSRKGGRQLEEILQRALVDRDPSVRRGALRGIEAATLADREGLLSPILVDESFENRLQAAGLLLAIRSAE